MANGYAQGAVVRLSFVVRDINGTPTDAATTAITVRRGDSVVDGPFSATRDGTGLYHYDYTTTVAGWHVWHCVTTVPAAVSESEFGVVRSI